MNVKNPENKYIWRRKYVDQAFIFDPAKRYGENETWDWFTGINQIPKCVFPFYPFCETIILQLCNATNHTCTPILTEWIDNKQ